MSGARRLQTEIDRTLKKVEEGVEVFDEVWEKVYAAQQQNQKEKYEVDLKKEIKKLQRFRDQIKTWISSHEVKDKGDLTEARKLIESKMEMFKVCEKETKTKTYSKEGLARAERLDPEEQAKDEARNFLQGVVEKLSLQIEATEADVEKLSSGKKNRNKDELLRKQTVIQRHLWHISKCEQIIRMIDNDAIETDMVEDTKDDIEYYVESGTDTEGMDDFDPYESLNLEEIPMVDPATLIDTSSSSSSSSKKKSKLDKEASKEEKVRLKDKKGGTSLLTIGRAVKNKEPSDKSSPSVPVAQPAPTPSPPTNQKLPNASPIKSSTPTPKPSSASLASILKGNDPVPNTKQLAPQQHMQQQQLAAQQQMQQKQATAMEQQRLQQQASQQRLQQQLQAASQQKALDQQRQIQQTAPQRVQQSEVPGSAFSGLMAGLGSATSPMASLGAAVSLSDPHTMALPMKSDKVPGGPGGPPSDSLAGSDGTSSASSSNDSIVSSSPNTEGTPEAPIGSNLGSGSSSGGAGTGGLGGSEDPIYRPAMDVSNMASALTALNGSLASMPTAHDRDRAKQYSPRNPFATPAAYYNAPGPSPVFEEAAIFEKFHTDTLFFIFYYQQGTYQQYLAARELKKQSWRFHKKYQTWFQRHEEPQVTTDEYEQGTYVYFDYQGTYDSKSGWCQRIKYDFTFEYEFLEDEL